ncbi:AAA family ATPase [Micromonospora parva]|uniref:NACHT and WD repeat domain-containing protein n=1 Tax=Micromonospora parva TaxID=1464048 RepID=UPI0033CB5C77
MSDVAQQARKPGHVEVFPVPIGAYRHHPPLAVDDEVGRIVELLSEVGGVVVPWDTPMAERGGDAVSERLSAWSQSSGSTILYWVGHGWSNGDIASLAHANSPKHVGAEGIPPEQLAHHIAEREMRSLDPDAWLIVIIDACQSSRFVQLLNASIDTMCRTRRILLVGTSAQGSTTLGRFSSALNTIIRDTFATEDHIEFKDIWAELKRNLPASEVILKNVQGTALRRRVTVPVGLAASLDVRTVLLQVLTDLPEDERRHFIPKAQGAELGEVSWYFEGRDEERQQVVDWLRDPSGGRMLILTGPAGAGKSALLGDILVRSRPAVSRVLARHGLLSPLPPTRTPPTKIFDVAIHLVGMTVSDATDRLSKVWGSDESIETGKPWGTKVELLLKKIGLRGLSTTLMVDGLDESAEPVAIASGILRPLAAVAGVRVVVGTRPSAYEGPDHPNLDDRGLLEALGTDEPNSHTIVLDRDPQAIGRYARRRLAIGLRLPANDPTCAAVSVAIAAAGREFLFAQLAVHEILARPQLLTDPGSLTDLLGGDHRNLFAAAVKRLARHNAAYGPLLRALGYAQGHGLPVRAGVWATFAKALVDIQPTGVTVSDSDISALIDDAAPYLTVDSEHGQTVYRLAHRTFVEYFLADSDTNMTAHSAIARACIAAADAAPGSLNPYLKSYALIHADAGDWKTRHLFLPPGPGADFRIDGLDRRAVRVFLIRNFARGGIEAEASVPLWEWTPIGSQEPLDHRPPSEIFTAFSVVELPAGRNRNLIATGGPDGTVRLWNTATGGRVGGNLLGHEQAIWTMAAISTSTGQSFLASADRDGLIILWDPISASPAGELRDDRLNDVSCLKAVPIRGREPVLAAAYAFDRSDENSVSGVHLWDPRTGTNIRRIECRSQTFAMTTFVTKSGHGLLATGCADGVIRLSDPLRGEAVGSELRGHTDWVRALVSFNSIDGRTLLASSGNDGTVLIWDVTAAGAPVPLNDPFVHCVEPGKKGASALAVIPQKNAPALIASGGYDGNIRLWNYLTGESWKIPIGNSVLSLEALRDGRVAVAGVGAFILKLNL